MKIEVKDILIIGLLVGILFFQWCGRNGPTNTERIISTDTVTTTRIDTFIDSTVVHHRTYDTIREMDTLVVEKGDTFDVAETTFNDTNMDLSVRTTYKGELKGQSVEYQLKIPQRIHRTDTVKITNKVEADKLRFRIGLSVEGSKNRFDAGPRISIGKRGHNFGYEYNLLDKTHEITYTKRIMFR